MRIGRDSGDKKKWACAEREELTYNDATRVGTDQAGVYIDRPTVRVGGRTSSFISKR